MIRWKAGLVAALAASTAPVAASPVFASLDRHGQLQVSDAPLAGAIAFDPHRPYVPAAPTPAKRAAMPGPVVPGAMPTAAKRWNPLIEQVAAEHGVDARLLHAIVRVESAYNHQARSHAGALGLMQVIPSTGKRFGAMDLFDPLQNLRAGTAYLVWLHGRFNGDLTLMLAAYNAGEGAVQRHGNRVPPFSETRRYVEKVTALYRGVH
ncbi:lytic transglycosylase domain-containing protein [uncultured Stenotrophomonas sp.]|uniref:lytic transglycosylase domain-containing protein n=1 Tax=uncultured Stenotrophomonas sp. TaxID=165438 RepID=UPI0028EC7407|nr:lytic transglycosylase domain-containing protein [uncultured Stenotrophomonas sp.]